MNLTEEQKQRLRDIAVLFIVIALALLLMAAGGLLFGGGCECVVVDVATCGSAEINSTA